jgi:hypothetical protein
MIACFDTSAINQMLDDSEGDGILSLLTHHYDVRITALNIVEIAKTRNGARREHLRALEFALSHGEAPYAFPNELLIAYTQALVAGKGELRITIGDERRELWVALAQPEAVTEEGRAKIIEWTKALDVSRLGAASVLRAAVEEKLPNATDRATNSIALIRDFMLRENWQFVYSLPAAVVKEFTGKVLAVSKLDRLLAAEPGFWAVYLVSTVLQMYSDAFWHRQHGRRNKVGLLDLWAGMYLPLCDCFITHDFDQFEALRIVNVFSKRRPRARVLRWSHFRKVLLAAG